MRFTNLIKFAESIKFPYQSWKYELETPSTPEQANKNIKNHEKDCRKNSELLESDIRKYITDRKSLFYAGAAAFLGLLSVAFSIISLVVSIVFNS